MAREKAGTPGSPVALRSEEETSPASGLTWRRWFLVVAAFAFVAEIVIIALPLRRPKLPTVTPSVELRSRVPPEVSPLLEIATEVADQLMEQYPENPDAVGVLVRLYLLAGCTDDAAKLCEYCLDLDGNYEPAYRWLASFAEKKGDLAQACQWYRKLLEISPDLPDVSVNLAELLMKQGQLEEAQTVAEDTLRRRPRFIAGQLQLGEILVQRREYEKARAILEAAIEYSPNHTTVYHALATACGKLGDKTAAEKYLEKFKALRAKEEQTHREVLTRQGSAFDLRVQVADIRAAAAKVYFAQGNPESAESQLRKAIELSPNHKQSCEVLAWYLERQGHAKEAMQLLAELSQSLPEDATTQVNFASLAIRQREFDQAEQALKRAIAAAPQHAAPRVALADVFLQTNNHLLEAKVLALAAVDLEPTAVNYFLLAATCERNGDLAAAHSALERALALDPQNADCQRALESLQGGKKS